MIKESTETIIETLDETGDKKKFTWHDNDRNLISVNCQYNDNDIFKSVYKGEIGNLPDQFSIRYIEIGSIETFSKRLFPRFLKDLETHPDYLSYSVIFVFKRNKYIYETTIEFAGIISNIEKKKNLDVFELSVIKKIGYTELSPNYQSFIFKLNNLNATYQTNGRTSRPFYGTILLKKIGETPASQPSVAPASQHSWDNTDTINLNYCLEYQPGDKNPLFSIRDIQIGSIEAFQDRLQSGITDPKKNKKVIFVFKSQNGIGKNIIEFAGIISEYKRLDKEKMQLLVEKKIYYNDLSIDYQTYLSQLNIINKTYQVVDFGSHNIDIPIKILLKKIEETVAPASQYSWLDTKPIKVKYCLGDDSSRACGTSIFNTGTGFSVKEIELLSTKTCTDRFKDPIDFNDKPFVLFVTMPSKKPPISIIFISNITVKVKNSKYVKATLNVSSSITFGNLSEKYQKELKNIYWHHFDLINEKCVYLRELDGQDDLNKLLHRVVSENSTKVKLKLIGGNQLQLKKQTISNNKQSLKSKNNKKIINKSHRHRINNMKIKKTIKKI